MCSIPKEIVVKNLQNTQPQLTDRGGNAFSVRHATGAGMMDKCSADFVEVEPGNFAYGYHYHEVSEEIFYIISGEGVVRTIKGDLPVKAGDLISFPTGPDGSHVIRNDSKTEKLVYIDFGTRHACDIAHLTDMKKMMVVSQQTHAMVDEP